MRMLYRRGVPVRFAETRDEVAVLLREAAERVHVTYHNWNPKRGANEPVRLPPEKVKPIEECHSPWCREALVASAPEFRCPNDWHAFYQPGAAFYQDTPGKWLDECPECGQNWIATETQANGTSPYAPPYRWSEVRV